MFIPYFPSNRYNPVVYGKDRAKKRCQVSMIKTHLTAILGSLVRCGLLRVSGYSIERY